MNTIRRIGSFFERFAHICCALAFVILATALCAAAYLFGGSPALDQVLNAIINGKDNLTASSAG